MNENGNLYAMAALKDRRARIAGEIFVLKKQIAQKLAQLSHLDATMALFDPALFPSSIPPKRVRAYQRVPLFSHGELGRVILDVLREARGRPLAGHEIAAAVMVKLKQPAAAKMAITSRVRSNLTYLKGQKGAVEKQGGGIEARWTLSGNLPTASPL